MNTHPIEAITYIDPEIDKKENELTRKGIEHILLTLRFVFERNVKEFLLGQTEQTEAAARFYFINAHGCSKDEKHHIKVNNIITETAAVLLEDILARDPQRKTPTIVLVDSCYSVR